MVICRHEELGLTLVGAILYCRIVLQAWFGWFASLNSENVDIWVFQKEPLQLLQYLQHWKSLDFPVLCQISSLKIHSNSLPYHKIVLSPEMLLDIQWWLLYIRTFNGVNFIINPAQILFTYKGDACLDGGGG